MTQPSISYQIKNLEKHLSIELFERKGRNVFLTAEGKILYDATKRGFETIQNGLTQIYHMAQQNLVTLCISSSVASPLILPGLPRFRDRHPEIDISLKILTRDINPSTENADFAIRLGDGNWDGLQSWKLFNEVYFPLCSPNIISEDAKEIALETLKSMDLLHLKERFRKRDGWSEFFENAGSPCNSIEEHLTFSDQQPLLDAAINGHGVGLGWLGMTDHFLKIGSLVKLTDIQIETEQAFYLIAPKGMELTKSAKYFRDWLVEECNDIQRLWDEARQRSENTS